MNNDFVLFLGRFHPLLVHLPIGFIVLLAGLELLSLVPRCKGANSQNRLIAAFTIPASLFSAACGWLLSRGGGYDAVLLNWHMWTGFGLALLCIVTYGLLRINFRRAYQVSLGCACGLLVIASHYGGSLTHGKDYLTRYAPQPIASLLGKRASTTPANVAQSPDILTKPAFSAAVQPVLQQYCVACHGPEKSKGELRVDNFALAMKGGENGPVLVPGKPSESELLKRILLPMDSEDHMPPEGKPQPSPTEISLLQWWVQAGAPEQKPLAELNPPEKIRSWLLARSSPSPGPPAVITPKPRDEVLPIADKLAEELDIAITALSAAEPWLQANASLAGTNFGDAELARLAPLASNLRWLDLAGTSVTDAGIAHVSRMPHLTRLHLERTGLSDGGFACLSGLKNLEYLNFHGTQVGDGGLAHLKGLPKLRQVYLWNTKVSPAGAKELQASLTDSSQIQFWQDEIAQLSAKIRSATAFVDVGTSTNLFALVQKPINTNCPISGKPIDASLTSLYGSNLVAFCCTNCQSAFRKDPKPFLAKLNLPASAPGAKAAAVEVEKISTTK